MGSEVPNYLVWSILCTILFFIPAGVVGIIYSVVARRRAARGDIEGGRRASHTAKISCWVSLVLGVFGYFLLASGAMHLPSLAR